MSAGSGGPGRHPCFDAGAAGRFGRVHLPVAGTCNIQCAYCDRRHDCVNESRPGVTSRLLSPAEALAHLDAAIAREPRSSVAGIAGPGDPLADPETTLATLALVRSTYPDLILCLATNGLALLDQVADLAALGVGFVTVTINAVDPVIGAGICLKARFAGRALTGTAAAGLLIERQLAGIAACKAAGMTVKVNTVVVPGINDGHAAAVAERAARAGADRMNLIGVIPLPGTACAGVEPPTPARLDELRAKAAVHLPQMRHCVRCRADAAGLLGRPGCRSEPAGAVRPSAGPPSLPTGAPARV